MLKQLIAFSILSYSYSFANACPDVSGIYTSGEQHQCLDWIENVGPYMCQSYKIITQRGCEELSFFEKEVVVNRDSNTQQYDDSSFMRLKKSNFSNTFFQSGDASSLPIDHEEYFPPSDGSGYCYSNKVKAKADGADGFLITIFHCFTGLFTETKISSGANLNIIQREDVGDGYHEHPIPGPWNPWQTTITMPKVSSLPDNTWLYDWFQGNMSGDVRLQFNYNDWFVEAIGRTFFSSEWNNLNNLEIQKTLNQLDKNKKYLCTFKGMTTMNEKNNSSYRATSLLVESINNCRVL